MKKIFTLFALAVIAAALTFNADAKSPRRALVGTVWTGPAIMDAREDVPADNGLKYNLRIEFGPGGNAMAQYIQTRGSHRGAVSMSKAYPIHYKIKQVYNDGSMRLEFDGQVLDASSALYKTRPRRWVYTTSAVLHDGLLICGLGQFQQINQY